MAGVALRSMGGVTLRELGVEFVSRARANQIARDEADRAIEEIREITPVDTSLMQSSWSIRRAVIDEMIADNTAPYAEWVHRAGERGTLFWRTYALPVWERAQQRALERVLDEEAEAEDEVLAEEIAAVTQPRVSSAVSEALEVVRRRTTRSGGPSVAIEAFGEWTVGRRGGQPADAILTEIARAAVRRVRGGRVRL